MKKLAASLGALATVLSTMAVPVLAPSVASAQSYDHRVERRNAYARRHYYRRDCRSARRSSGNKGTVAGALVGGASGALIGGDVLGGLVGAGVGAVAGHQIAKSRVKC